MIVVITSARKLESINPTPTQMIPSAPRKKATVNKCLFIAYIECFNESHRRLQAKLHFSQQQHLHVIAKARQPSSRLRPTGRVVCLLSINKHLLMCFEQLLKTFFEKHRYLREQF